MKRISFGQLVLLLVLVIHVVMKCQATFCIDHHNKLAREIHEHQSHCSDQVKNRSQCICEAEASSLEERRRNYEILCQGKLYKVNNQIILDFIASNLKFLMPSYTITFFMEKIITYNFWENVQIFTIDFKSPLENNK